MTPLTLNASKQSSHRNIVLFVKSIACFKITQSFESQASQDTVENVKYVLLLDQIAVLVSG